MRNKDRILKNPGRLSDAHIRVGVICNTNGMGADGDNADCPKAKGDRRQTDPLKHYRWDDVNRVTPISVL